MSPQPDYDSSRRNFLGTGLAVAASLVASSFDALNAAASPASVSTPEVALAELLSGNKRFSSNRRTSQKQDLAALRQQTSEKQEPFAAVLSCADSRVPVELIFDQTIGQIFVARVAGNVVTPELIGSLEYGAEVLGTKAILVMGHSGCGAVKATIAREEVPGQISSLFPHIQPAVNQAGTNLEAATKANAKIQADLLRDSSTVMSSLIKKGKLKVVAGYYDLATGSVEVLT
jgi:carbonic anhydrase